MWKLPVPQWSSQSQPPATRHGDGVALFSWYGWTRPRSPFPSSGELQEVFPIQVALRVRRSRVRFSFALAVSFILTISFGVACQTLTTDPFVSEGQRIYKAQCIASHGPVGQGDGYVLFTPPVADLTSEHIQKKLDAEIFRSIHQGSRNTAMGSWRLVLSDEETAEVIEYVRQLGRDAPVKK